jgi:hypothetical protein
MLEELAHESMTEERLDALDRELDDIMRNLTGPTVDETKGNLAKVNLDLSKCSRCGFAGFALSEENNDEKRDKSKY